MWAVSIPARVAVAEWKALKPRIGAVILFEDVVEAFHLQTLDRLARAGELEDDVHRVKASQVGTAFVDDHPIRHAVGSYRTTQEPARCRQVPML